MFLPLDLCDSLRVEFCCVKLGVYKLNSKLLEADPSFDAPSALCMKVSYAYKRSAVDQQCSSAIAHN